jgi:hypothetical protein
LLIERVDEQHQRHHTFLVDARCQEGGDHVEASATAFPAHLSDAGHLHADEAVSLGVLTRTCLEEALEAADAGGVGQLAEAPAHRGGSRHRS